MVKKSKIIFVLLLYYFLAGCFLFGFWSYLNKPTYSQWDEAAGLVRERGTSSPLLFSPSWLKNYATDFSRFDGFTFLSASDSKPADFWTVSFKKLSEPEFQAIYSKQIGRLYLVRWVKPERINNTFSCSRNPTELCLTKNGGNE